MLEKVVPDTAVDIGLAHAHQTASISRRLFAKQFSLAVLLQSTLPGWVHATQILQLFTDGSAVRGYVWTYVTIDIQWGSDISNCL